MPFIAENIWQVLKNENDPISVHLCDWPKEQKEINQELVDKMKKLRLLVEKGRALRAEAGIRNRQPLKKMVVDQDLSENFKNILKDDLNVLEVELGKAISLDTEITPELKEEGIRRDIVRLIQDLRKQAGLIPNDKAKIHFETEKELTQIIEKAKSKIEADTSTELISGKIDSKHQIENGVDSKKIWLGLE